MAHFTCEVVYRGIFQKNLAARICRGIVLSARKAGRWGIAFGRYGDSPQRNGIPAKDFAIVADSQEELEQNTARYEPKPAFQRGHLFARRNSPAFHNEPLRGRRKGRPSRVSLPSKSLRRRVSGWRSCATCPSVLPCRSLFTSRSSREPRGPGGHRLAGQSARDHRIPSAAAKHPVGQRSDACAGFV